MKCTFLTFLIFCSLTVTYAQVSKTVNLTTAGTLSTVLTAYEKITISNLTVTGKIDARDFTTMEDEMTLLQVLDLSEANIVAFSGVRKLNAFNVPDPENAIPFAAFADKTLNSIIIPNTADSLNKGVFQNFSGNINVNEKNDHFSSLDGILFNKTQTILLKCPVSKSGVYTVPSTVTHLGREAFLNCKYLTQVLLPTKLTRIDDSAFRGCKNLTQVLLPKLLTYIGPYAFGECIGLKSFTVPESVSFIGESALFTNQGDCKFDINVDENNPYFSSLDNVVFDKNKTRLMICSRLKSGSYTIPSTVTTIDPRAFAVCGLLTSIQIPISVINIGETAFADCSNWKGTLTIPSSITKIADFTFGGCDFTSVLIPNTITSIGDWAFIANRNLKTITIPSSVNHLGELAFSCENLTSIYANSSVPIFIDQDVSKDVFGSVNKAICKLYVPYGTKSLYSSANQWKDFANIIEDTKGFSIEATNIELASAEGSIASVNIKSNVNWVASSNQSWLQISSVNRNGTMYLTVTAASSNPLLTVRTAKVTISAVGELSEDIIITQEAAAKTINNIEGNLFTNLTSDELKTVTNLVITGTIDARDFKTMRDNMPLLAELDLSGATVVAYSGTQGTNISNTVYQANTIPVFAFYDSENGKGKSTLEKVVLPQSITTIGFMAFAGPSGLSSINIPNSTFDIVEYAFRMSGAFFTVGSENINYSSLDGVLFSKDKTILLSYPSSKEGNYDIPSTVTTIEQFAFYGCSSLTSVVFPSSIIKIGDFAFCECGGLTGTLTIPNSVTSIGYCAFFTCRGLTGTLTIPSSVNSIGGFAFANCNGFTSLVIPSSVTSIDNSAFAACQGLTSIYANSTIPIDLSSVTNVFEYVDTNKCILYVPVGSKSAYQSSAQWKEFTNIKEYYPTEVVSLYTDEISIYPNPIIDGVRFRGIKGKSTYRIFDIKGKLLNAGDVYDDEFVSVSSLSKGVYIVKITSSLKNYEFKVLKN